MSTTATLKRSPVLRLTESGIMLAFAFVLSFVKVIDMPFGGSVTACSMLPVILVAYRSGVVWGLFTGFAFSLLQLLTGLNNLSYASSAWAAAAILLLDYLVAFTVLGLGGVLRNRVKNQTMGLFFGTLLVCALRYLCHVITGCTVWAGVSIPSADGLIYSLAYNAAYMIPETILTLVGAVYLSRVLDFRRESLTRMPVQQGRPFAASLCSAVSLAAIAAAVATDALLLFSSIQNEAGFDITQIQKADWKLMAIVTVVAVAVAILAYCIGRWFVKKAAAAPKAE